MKFKFKLEILLKQRKRLMEQAQVEYAEAQNLVNKKMQEINNKYESIQRTREKIFKCKSLVGHQAAIFNQGEDYIIGAKKIIENYRTEVRALMATAEEKHQQLIDKTKDYKIIEKLKEKKRAQHKKDNARKEQKSVEDINILRFGRRVL